MHKFILEISLEVKSNENYPKNEMSADKKKSCHKHFQQHRKLLILIVLLSNVESSL